MLCDSGCKANKCNRTQDDQFGPTQTKCITVPQYVDYYAGPENALHFKYSSILVQVYIALMFGFVIPVLFLTTLLGIINMYIYERIVFAYYTRRPPRYDARLARSILSLMTPAPFFMFGVGYWAMTNP